MRRRAGAVAALLLGAAAAFAQPLAVLDEPGGEPRAFGHHVGDVVERRVAVFVPDGLALEDASLPRIGGRGRALELREVGWRALGAGRHELRLAYQVFLSPPELRTLEMPPVLLRFAGRPRAQELRIDAWPVTVGPLVAAEAPSRRGLGELQPDVPAPAIDTTGIRNRLQAWAALALLPIGWLLRVYVGLPWQARRSRPFAAAHRQLAALPAQPDDAQWRHACRQLHEALNRSAGQVLFESGVAAYVAAQPRFAALRDDLTRFLQLTRREFFAGMPRVAEDARWLVVLARRLRDAERGS